MLFSKKHAFRPLSTVDEDEEIITESKTPQQERKRFLWKYLLLCAAIITVILIVAIGGPFVNFDRTPTRWSSCGDSLETARERGCSFDLISFAWQTPECYDRELVEEFASWDNWTFYADPKWTQPVTQERALQGDLSLFVQWDYHIVHCTFMWRQMHRAYMRGFIDSHLGGYNHTMHCQKMILVDSTETDRLVTVARVIYPVCNKV